MQLQIGSTETWLLWLAVELFHRVILGVYISRHRNILAAEAFLSQMINRIVWKPFSILDDGYTILSSLLLCTSRSQSSSSYERNIFERVIEYFKDRIEDFDDYYYQCLKEECNL
jgi:transposase-like protein